ncbi:MAG TPA: T3SS effector HopA1 family protein [Candidatus Saccharimonadaceae bacterium]|nr:T3SS effector HopA1 family protein [Candidatus Saccharimonadaceae bacterium]
MNPESFTPHYPESDTLSEFESHPRTFTLEDVYNVQQYLADLKAESIKEGADFAPSSEGLYERLTERVDSGFEQEARAAEDSFDKSVHALFSEWATQKGIAESAPTSLLDIKKLFVQYPNLNEKSPIHFQGGAEFATSRFVHVKTGRAMGMAREETTTRYYLNPTADTMGRVVEQLTGAALEAKVPLYFKFVDVATENPDRRTLSRNDRVVIYASDAQREFVESTIQDIIRDVPDGLEGRTVAGFAEEIADGVARSSEVNESLNQQSGSRESFNSLRTKLIYEATIAVTRRVLSSEQNASIQVGSNTVRGTLAEAVSKELKKLNYPEIKEDDPTLLQAVALGLEPDKLVSAGFSDKAANAVNKAVRTISKDILPAIPADILLKGYERQLDSLAPRYGINPHNLAENIPIAS